MAIFQKPRGTDTELHGVARRMQQALRESQTPWNSGILKENIKFIPNQPRQIVHNLGKKPRGFIIVDFEIADKSTAIPSDSYTPIMIQNDSRTATIVVTSSDSTNIVLSIWFW